jgi:hypothetical protein
MIARARRRRNLSLAYIAIVAAGLACNIGVLFGSTVSPFWDLLKQLPLGWDVYVVIVASGTPLMLSILWVIKIKHRAAFESGMCKHCGYDLDGRSEGICSECGAQIQN